MDMGNLFESIMNDIEVQESMMTCFNVKREACKLKNHQCGKKIQTGIDISFVLPTIIIDPHALTLML